MPICLAIVERRMLSFTYQGHPRLVIPAAHGLHASTGKAVLRGYQVGGTSSSRATPLWDLFRLDTVTAPLTLGEPFGDIPPDDRRDDQHIEPLCCQL